jgi:hypothetical protein
MPEYLATILMATVGSGLLLGFRAGVMSLAKLSETPRRKSEIAPAVALDAA